jgi:hypothetical protein
MRSAERLPHPHRAAVFGDLFLKCLGISELRLESCESIDESIPRRDGSITVVNFYCMANEITHRSFVQKRQPFELAIELRGNRDISDVGGLDFVGVAVPHHDQLRTLSGLDQAMDRTSPTTTPRTCTEAGSATIGS